MLRKSYLFFIILSFILTPPASSTESDDEASTPSTPSGPIEDDRATPIQSPLQMDLPSSKETPVETKEISKKSGKWCCLQREDDD